MVPGDGHGRCPASVPLPSTLIGTRLDHAFIVIDLKKLAFDFASNWAPLTLIK
ncbi:MAG: hypothetical protein ACE5F1_09370 [Planctomycetota bacterium]